MEPGVTLAALLVLGLVAAVVYEWTLASPLFELGAVSWTPAEADLPAGQAVVRGAVAGLVPLAATTVAAVLVFTTPFRVWAWAVVGLLGATVVLSPLLAVYRYRTRRPTDEERAALTGIDVGRVLVVEDAHDGPVNGYAIGGPFRDVIGVSAFALDHLCREEVAALLAHEACHHEERHVLVRGVVSVAVLAVGTAVLTARFDSLVPLATLGLVTTIVVERVVAFWVLRRLEYRADAAAARQTSVESVDALLTTLEAATGVDQRRVPLPLRLFSTHPPYADRRARLAGGDRLDGASATSR